MKMIKNIFLKYIKGPDHFAKLRIINFIFKNVISIFEVDTESGRMLLNSNDLIQKACLLTNKFEPDVFNLHKKILKKGDIYLDVGANCGVFSLLASKLIGSTGKVLAIEPNPKTNVNLQHNKSLNLNANNILIYCCAVGGKEELCWLKIPPNENSGLAKITLQKTHYQSVIVAMFKLSKIIKKQKIKKIKLLKIDTEGTELPILKDLFQKRIFPKNIIFEYLPQDFKNHEKLIYLFKKHKYKLHDLSGNPFSRQKINNIWAVQVA